MTNPTMTRRALIQRGALTGALAISASSLALEGCNASQWIATALNDLPIILQIDESIISIVGAAKGGTDPNIIAQAEAAAAQAKQALTEAQAFIQQYQANATPGLLSQIDAALTTAQSQLGSILTVLHITNTQLQATLAAGIGSALTIVVAIQALVPPPPAASAKRVALHSASNQSASMKQAYNEAVTAAGGAQFAIQ